MKQTTNRGSQRAMSCSIPIQPPFNRACWSAFDLSSRYYRHLLVPALLIIFTTAARADVIGLTESASDALANLGTKFVIGCAFLALGMVGAAIALRKNEGGVPAPNPRRTKKITSRAMTTPSSRSVSMISPENMKLQFTTATVTLLAISSCSTPRDVDYPPPASASEVARKLPPLKIPVPVSPVDLRTAVLTLPADALAGMSPDGRRNYLASTKSEATTAGVFDKANRRLELICDNPHVGIDAKSMFYLRLFEDDEGRTIAASHSARPFADGSKPSSQFTRVYRLENQRWHDITDSVFPSGIPKSAFFRFDQRGSKIGFGEYKEENRADGRGKCYHFGSTGRTMQWKSGAFHEDRNF